MGRLEEVTVTASGQRFGLQLVDVPFVLSLSGKQSRVGLEVLSPLHFAATVPREQIRLRPRGLLELHGGRLVLGSQAIHEYGAASHGELSIPLKQTLGVEVKPGVAVPCSQLTQSEDDFYHSPQKRKYAHDTLVGLGPGFVPLHSIPGDGDPVLVRYAGGWHIEQEMVGWFFAEVHWADGSHLRGWVPASYKRDRFEPIVGFGASSTTDRACDTADGATREPATLKPGAEVAFSPRGAVWARASGAVRVEIVHPNPNDAWVHLYDLPGIHGRSCEAPPAWVKRQWVEQ